MNKNAKKAKRAYLGKLRTMVASHVHDLGKQILDEGIENAKENHGVKLPVEKRMKDIVKEVVTVNMKVKNYVKATKDEVQEVLKEGTKQAIVAIKNDNKDMTNEEDKFFKSLDIDIDDLDDEDWDDINDEDTGDGYDDDISEESFARDMWQGAKNYTEMVNATVISQLSNDDICAAILLLVQNCKCQELQSVISTHVTEIENIIKGSTAGEVDEIKPGTGDKLNYVKNMINEVNTDMVPNIGTEDGEELEEVGIVVEVIPTELPTAVPESNRSLNLKRDVHRVIHMFFDKVENCINQDKEILGMLSVAESKISGVCTYLATLTGISDLEVRNRIMSTIEDVSAVSELPVSRRLTLAFYLGIIPEDLMEQGCRIVSVYYNKIDK